MNSSTIRTLRRYGMAFALPGMLFGLVTAVVVLVVRPLYLSIVTFAPDTQESAGLGGALSGMAGPFAQLGLNLFGERGRSLAFYGYLAQSENVAEAVVERAMPDSIGPSASLAHLWYEDKDDVRLRTYYAIRRFRHRTTVRADERTGIIQVRFLGESPALAQWVTTAMYDELNRYNIEVRGSPARERRRFLDERVAVSSDSLRLAEAALRDFYEQNRQWDEDQQLVFRERQLNRQVDAHLEVLNSLRRELEVAKLDEVRDTPVLNIVQPPSLPVKKAWPPRTRLTLLWTLLGGVIGMAMEFGRPWVGSMFRRAAG